MSARDDFGSDAGRPGGRGGSNGGLANGGVGGGRGGGGGGGGAGRNGGYGSNTGLQTGNKMYGNSAYGRPGGRALNLGAWGIRPQPAIQQSALNRPTYPGALSPIPASYPPNVTYPQEPPIPYGGLMFGNGSLWPGQGVTPQPSDIPYGGLMFGNGSLWPGQSTLSGNNGPQYNPNGPGKQFYDRVPQDAFMSDASVSGQRRGR